MSTRCTIHFKYKGESALAAIIYRHSDGYPDGDNGVLADLQRFFADVQKQTRDTRFGDPSYLAAKFVVWQAGELAVSYVTTGAKMERASHRDTRPLDFLGVGIVLSDSEPDDIDHRYTVTCGGDGTPAVTHQSVRS